MVQPFLPRLVNNLHIGVGVSECSGSVSLAHDNAAFRRAKDQIKPKHRWELVKFILYLHPECKTTCTWRVYGAWRQNQWRSSDTVGYFPITLKPIVIDSRLRYSVRYKTNMVQRPALALTLAMVMAMARCHCALCWLLVVVRGGSGSW